LFSFGFIEILIYRS